MTALITPHQSSHIVPFDRILHASTPRDHRWVVPSFKSVFLDDSFDARMTSCIRVWTCHSRFRVAGFLRVWAGSAPASRNHSLAVDDRAACTRSGGTAGIFATFEEQADEKNKQMNLGRLAAFRGEAWARRMLRGTLVDRYPPSKRPWPGKIREARRLARAFGRPNLVEALAAIIQECAAAAWTSPADS